MTISYITKHDSLEEALTDLDDYVVEDEWGVKEWAPIYQGAIHSVDLVLQDEVIDDSDLDNIKVTPAVKVDGYYTAFHFPDERPNFERKSCCLIGVDTEKAIEAHRPIPVYMSRALNKELLGAIVKIEPLIAGQQLWFFLQK